MKKYILSLIGLILSAMPSYTAGQALAAELHHNYIQGEWKTYMFKSWCNVVGGHILKTPVNNSSFMGLKIIVSETDELAAWIKILDSKGSVVFEKYYLGDFEYTIPFTGRAGGGWHKGAKWYVAKSGSYLPMDKFTIISGGQKVKVPVMGTSVYNNNHCPSGRVRVMGIQDDGSYEKFHEYSSPFTSQ